MKDKRLIYGVGVNDADYFVKKSQRINGVKKEIWVCPFYRAWKDMIKRAYSPKHLAAMPCYEGVQVCDEWLTFSNFKAWMEKQDWQGKQLDKDILVEGNNVYGPDTCVFVSGALNTFFAYKQVNNTSGYIGVSWHNIGNKWSAKIKNPFILKEEYLGLFHCPKEAHLAWKKRKHELALIYAEQETDERIKHVLTTRFLPGGDYE